MQKKTSTCYSKKEIVNYYLWDESKTWLRVGFLVETYSSKIDLPYENEKWTTHGLPTDAVGSYVDRSCPLFM